MSCLCNSKDVYGNVHLQVPNSCMILYPGDRVKLGRFEYEKWTVEFGWYTWGGNRPVCGWYLIKDSDPGCVKPLQYTDLDDIYFIEK